MNKCKSNDMNAHLRKVTDFGRSRMTKGVFGGPSGPSREGPGVGHKIVSDTKQMTKEREKKK